MPYPDVTSGDIMDRSAALNNDPSKTIYTYTKQLPYLNSALQELQELFELNEVPVTDTQSEVIEVAAGQTEIGFEPAFSVAGTAYLPNDLIEPVQLWERQSGINPYTPMTRVNQLSLTLAGVQVSQFINYIWESQKIKVNSSVQNNDIKIDYIRFLFKQFTSINGADKISVVNARSFLEFRTGGLVAANLAENPTRSQELNNNASLALDRAIGISAKSRQSIMTRRRPFRAGFKSRNVM